VSVVAALLAAAGLTITLSGVPGFGHGRVRRRVEPYLSGLHGTAAARHNNIVTSITARLTSPAAARDVARRLNALRSRRSVAEFRVEQLLWGVGAALGMTGALLAVGMIAGLRLDGPALGMFAAVAFACGWVGRDWWLSRVVRRRQELMGEQLPTAIDLVTLSLMAGESVPAAFERAAAVLSAGIGEEFAEVVADIRGGSPVLDALERLKNRFPGYNTVRFVDALVTGIEKGAPLADVLRAQADDVREARRRSLIESGGRREVVMLVPVVFLIMPVVVVYALYPGLVSLKLLVP
jgi:tight adherence protein C